MIHELNDENFYTIISLHCHSAEDEDRWEKKLRRYVQQR